MPEEPFGDEVGDTQAMDDTLHDPYVGGVTARRVRVMVVDDHEVVRRALVELCEAAPGLQVVACAASVEEALRRGPAARPDVVILDLHLPDGNGLAVMHGLRECTPGTRFVVLTGLDEDDRAAEASAAGTGGCVLETVRGDHLVETVLAVADGPVLLEGQALDRPRRPSEHPLAALTPAERSVVQCLSEGLNARETGMRLGVCEQTVKNHVTSVMTEMGFRRRTQLAAWVTAGRLGVARPPVPAPRSASARPAPERRR